VHQNGMLKVWLVKFKENLMKQREEMDSDIEVIPIDIIPMFIYAWNQSFVNTVTNILAILERGWFPLNCNLLFLPVLHATVTIMDKEQEAKNGVVPDNNRNNNDHVNNTFTVDKVLSIEHVAVCAQGMEGKSTE
jgi:hypothetical protein